MPPEIIKVDTPQKLDGGLRKGADVIRAGGVVAIPTESFYGLAVDATNDKAVKRLYRIKKRERDKPVLLLIGSPEGLNRYVKHIPATAGLIIDRFWPGGLTMIFDVKEDMFPLLTAGTGKIGIRLSSHPVATGLARAAGIPITGTSANISGRPACRRASEVPGSIETGLDLVLDGGETAGESASTILDVTVTPHLILRDGMVSRDALEEYFRGET